MLEFLADIITQTITYSAPVRTVYAQEIQVEEPEEPLPIKVEKKEECKYPSCVRYVRTKLPNLKRGNAKDFQPNTGMKKGVAILLKYNVHHIAYVEDITNDGIWISEANFESCKITHRLLSFRELPTNLIGFYDPNIIMEEEQKVDVEETTEEETEETSEEVAEEQG